MKLKSLKLSVLFVLLLVFAIPVNLASAAVDQKQEAIDYFDALEKLAKYEMKALNEYSTNYLVTSYNRKAIYKSFAYTIVPNYQKFVAGLKAMKAPTTPEFLKLHKAGISAATQQLSALTLMKNALYKNPMDKTAWNKANKILKTAAPLMNKWGEDLAAYYDKVVTSAEEEEAEFEEEIIDLEEEGTSYEPRLVELPLSIDEKTAADALRDEAIAFYHSYARAVLSGDTSEMDDLLTAMIEPKIDASYFGPDYSIEKNDESIEEFIENNDADILEDWAKDVLASEASDLEVDFTTQSKYSLSIFYSLDHELFDTSIPPSISFFLDNRDGEYVLSALYVD